MGASGVANPATRADRADERTDEQLLEAYLNGDNPAFQRLVERYQRELYHFLVRFLGDRAAAEDVFQETFLQVHQSGAQFDLARRFRPWLFTIAANKARDLMRSQARRPTSPLQAEISPGEGDTGGQFIDLMAADIPAPSDAMGREEVETAVHDTVMGMPEHLREILLLSYFNQFPYKQIADILDIPLGTVKSRLHAAVASFGERWRERVRDWEDSTGGRGGARGDGDAERSEGRPAPSSLRRGSGGGPGTSGNSPRTGSRGENRQDPNDRRFGT